MCRLANEKLITNINRMKILNLYAGIGGNRKLWGSRHQVTAVEKNEEIASIYKDMFPCDQVVVGDAHEYLKIIIKNMTLYGHRLPARAILPSGRISASATEARNHCIPI